MWLEFVVGCASLGFLMGWDRSTNGDDPRYIGSHPFLAKFFALVWLALIIATKTASIRGFFIVYLSSLGAYYLSKNLGELLEKVYCSVSQKVPKITVEASKFNSEVREVVIALQKCAGVKIDSIFLQDSKQNTIPIQSAECNDEELFLGHNGWIQPKNLILRRNGYARLKLTAGNWPDVEKIRIWGTWANGVSWLFEKNFSAAS